jgi:predicted nuclease of restriction endonuclease-like RecB superfamily
MHRPPYLLPSYESIAAQVHHVLSSLEGCVYHEAEARLQTWVLMANSDPVVAELARTAIEVWPRQFVSPKVTAANRLNCYVDGQRAPLELSAFYDLLFLRPLGARSAALTPQALCLEVNRRRLARIVGGCWKLQIQVGEGISTLVRCARFSGLLVWPVTAEGGKIDLHCCGPLQVFGKSFAYARGLVGITMHALVRFNGTVLITPSQDSSFVYQVCAGDPVAVRPRESVDFDSELERRCYVALVKAVGDECSISREPGCILAGKSLVIPDFGLCFLDGRPDVLLEVMGFWTEAYLKRKSRLLEHPSANALKFLATREVVEKLPAATSLIGEGRLFVFERRVNLKELRAWVLKGSV